MTALAIVLAALSGVGVMVWTSRHIMINAERRKGFVLTEAYAGPPQPAPKITVIVAAKDEADNIETCLRTMLQQDYPNFELVVCNDRSTDGTGDIVRRVAAGDSRVRLINIERLPEGWCGKNNAMQTGIAATDGEWICMIDADCRQQSPRTLSTAMQYAADQKTDFLSVLPTLEMKGFWENVIQPVCSGVMMIWFHPDRVNDPARPNAYANGAFMLVKRSTYQAIGTHEAVKSCVNEDMHLARLAKEGGHKLRVVRGKGLFIVRMYVGGRQVMRGWIRIFFGTFGTLKRLTVSLAVLVIMGLLPYAAAAAGLWAWSAGGGCAWLAAGMIGSLAAVLQLTVMYRFYGLVGARRGLFWTYPIGCAAAALAVATAMRKLRRGATVTWRGTHYVRPN